jgi:hypothetical protein
LPSRRQGYEPAAALASIATPRAATTKAGDSSDPAAHRDRLFEQDETGKTSDPEQGHDAAKEQQAHQEPAAVFRGCRADNGDALSSVRLRTYPALVSPTDGSGGRLK